MTAAAERGPSVAEGLHADAARLLAGWPPPDGAQDALRRDYLAHLSAHPDAMWRSCLPGHLTASAAVLDASGRRVLLTLHARLRMWLQLGGHCEAGDLSLLGAALREAAEESGIGGLRPLGGPVRLDRHPVPCGGGSFHLDVQFAMVAPEGAVAVRDARESDDLAWFPVGGLPEGVDGSVRALVAAAISRFDRGG
ncbi:NUDIX hydrolase [Allonocardiopsis opalescens]|uniref:8-oxo-dGTP pyrophosphatase MutT (NUDIX family) n=1 Tax=Allonocardiopsis opalescens TaxID=1144618 RepID=A0A2T0QDP9_9ACTN|nr:NUDIX hydrolase [Allonocardiopsis opalescens]PRY02028.1 8-oxo-dGTP pyrophosphatase MutT (NUDIX family) [Allonocardiopsis opalescens]